MIYILYIYIYIYIFGQGNNFIQTRNLDQVQKNDKLSRKKPESHQSKAQETTTRGVSGALTT